MVMCLVTWQWRTLLLPSSKTLLAWGALHEPLVMRGATIYEVRDLMRHVDVKTTERYAHLSDKAKRKAAELLDGLTG